MYIQRLSESQFANLAVTATDKPHKKLPLIWSEKGNSLELESILAKFSRKG